MFSALQAVSSIVLRDIISLAILSGILLMMYSEGLTRGVADADLQDLGTTDLPNGTTLEPMTLYALFETPSGTDATEGG